MNFKLSSLLIVVFLISGCNFSQTSAPTPAPRQNPQNAASVKPQAYTKEATLVAVGDIMMHGSQIRSGYNPQEKTYNFDSFFTEVKPILSPGHWVIGNLETTLAGAEAGGYTGYPLFNAPAELVDATKKAGFNILTTANNHSLDRGEKGVIRTLKNIRNRGLLAAGTATSAKEADTILMVTKNEIKMAILAYTYDTNGIPIPKGKPYLVSLINPEKMVKDIAKARAQGADIITVCLHFGDEYQRQPNTQQKKLVETLIKAGADIILGSHPHVVQPYQIFERPGKTGTIQKAVAIYSMGNFISGQVGNYKDLGVIFTVKIRKQFPEKTVEFTQIEAIPTWVHRYPLNGKLNFRVLPLEAVLSQKNDPLLPQRQYPILATYLKEMNRHLNALNSSAKAKSKPE